MSKRTGENFVRERLAEMPKAPVLEPGPKVQVKMPEMGGSEGGSPMPMAQLKAPTRPTLTFHLAPKLAPFLVCKKA